MEKCEVIKGFLARVSNSNRAGGTAGTYPLESRMMMPPIRAILAVSNSGSQPCMDFLCPLMLVRCKP